jgi:hypothetical protein
MMRVGPLEEFSSMLLLCALRRLLRPVLTGKRARMSRRDRTRLPWVEALEERVALNYTVTDLDTLGGTTSIARDQ